MQGLLKNAAGAGAPAASNSLNAIRPATDGTTKGDLNQAPFLGCHPLPGDTAKVVFPYQLSVCQLQKPAMRRLR